jgi:RimJ/RimL family protein N-acetyltransferase
MADAVLSQRNLGFKWAPDYTPLHLPAQPFIDSLIKFAGMHLFVDKDALELLGYSRFEADRRQPDVVWLYYSVAQSRERRGYATEGVGAQVRWLLERAEIEILKADVARSNLASKAVLKKLGFTPTAPGIQEVWQLSRTAMSKTSNVSR